MENGTSIMPKGIAFKMVRMIIIFVVTMGILFMVIFGVHLSGIMKISVAGEKRQLELLSESSGRSMTDITEENLKSLITSAVDRTNDEFLVQKQDLIALKSMTEEVFKHPEVFGRKEISPPKMENKGKPALQVLSPNGFENISPSTYEKMQRLANLEPLMRENVLSADYIVDFYISTPDGVTLAFDRLSEGKFDENGNIKNYDARERKWFKGAVETNDVYFYSVLKSSIYGYNEVVYSLPVYVEGELVAVLEGCFDVNALSKYMVGREIGESGFAILVGNDGLLSLSTRRTGELKQDNDNSTDITTRVNPELQEVIKKGLSGETGLSRVHVDGEEYYAAYGAISIPKWTQILFVSVNDVTEPANRLILELENRSNELISKEKGAFNAAIAIAGIIILIALAITNVKVRERARKRVTPIARMTEQLNEFSGVNMFFEMEDIYRTGDEVQVLAESFEAQAARMRDYVDAIVDEMSEKERVKTELSLATKIQADMLPNIFPAFPERDEFNIYASMTPAKEVGGDFYDFFFAGENHLAMVMADVSGKGVPAAMFMMMAKSMIQSRIMAKRDAKEVLEDVNNLICSNNREKMFVTVWVGILDINTGVMTASNAGHEYPVLKEPEGRFEIIKDKHGFVIGGKKNMKYTDYEIRMKPGSKLFVYTDGVPEAMDADRTLFGMERMVNALNAVAYSSAEEILANVDKEVGKFVGSAEQFDDLTMLCIEYFGKKNPVDNTSVKNLYVKAQVESLTEVKEFIDGELEALDCPVKAKGQIDVAVDELFGNIAHYAYEGEPGDVTVRTSVSENPKGIVISFIDRGTPFNPLDAKNPDVTLKAKERVKGGLGIYLVKKTMDDVNYEFKDGQNILTITKKLD